MIANTTPDIPFSAVALGAFLLIVGSFILRDIARSLQRLSARIMRYWRS